MLNNTKSLTASDTIRTEPHQITEIKISIRVDCKVFVHHCLYNANKHM